MAPHSTSCETAPSARATFSPRPDPRPTWPSISWAATSLDNATFRGDLQLSAKDSLFARFSFNRGTISGEAPLPAPADTPVNEHLPAWNVGVGYTRVFGPALVNEFRFAWSRPGLDKDGTVPRNEIV